MLEEILDKNKVYYQKLQNGQRRRLDMEEIAELSLNSENYIPEINGQKTWVSNYVAKFWAHKMKPQGFALYFQLLSMAYGEKDYAFPSVSHLCELTGMSRRSVQKYLLELADLKFVIIIESQNAKTNEFDSNIYMLSNTIPFISKEHYDNLPERLQKQHDKFVEMIKKRKIMKEVIEY